MSTSTVAFNIKKRFDFLRNRTQFDQSVVTLRHKRIYILPNQRGFGFVLLIVLLLLIAFVYNNNLAYLLDFFLASVFFITILHSFKNLAGLEISTGQTHAAFAGDLAGFDIYVDNPTPIAHFNLQLDLPNSTTHAASDLFAPKISAHLEKPLFQADGQQKQKLTLYATTQKRGWHPCGTIILSSTYPLGFFRAWSVLKFDFKALVYPKPATGSVPFPETEGTQAQQGTVKKGHEDFYGLKEYQAGDAIRDIHWKAFAKGQGLYSKYYSGEALAELWLSYELTTAVDTEQRLSQMCRWLIDADKAGLTYGFKLPHLKIEPSSGTAHFKRCLEALALF